MCWIACCKKINWSPNSQYFRVWLYSEIGLLQMLLVKMRSYWSRVALNPVWLLSLYEDDMKTHEKIARWQWRWRLERCIHKARNTKGCMQAPEARRGKERFSLTGLRRSMVLLKPWFQSSSLQNCETINLCCHKPLSLWYLLWQA